MAPGVGLISNSLEKGNGLEMELITDHSYLRKPP